MNKKIQPIAIALIVTLASCATRYEPPPSSVPTSSVFLIGNGGQVRGGRNNIAVNIVDPSSCENLQHIGPVAAGETKELKLPVGKPVTIKLSYFRLRPELEVGKGPIEHCQDGVTLTPQDGREYRVGLDSQALRSMKCNNDVKVRLVGQDAWKNAERERVCSD